MDKSWIVRVSHNAEKNEAARRMRREITPAENMLWQAVRGNKLGGLHFRRQQVIDGFVADFYCHAAALVVEVDGGVHDKQGEEDRHRERTFSLRGLRTLRFSNDRIFNDLPNCLVGIQSAANIVGTSH